MEKNNHKVLNLFTWGNPSRGDDAIGPTLHQIIKQFIASFSLTQIQLIEDFQLQPEHVCDISGDACVIFIDASCQGDTAYQITPVHAAENIGYTSHALSPSALMTLYQKTQHKPSPPAFLVSVRGYDFGLGAPLSKQAKENIKLVTPFLKALLTCQDPVQLLQQTVVVAEEKSDA
ncbi:MAG: hydrogenase maturation protease [Psychromonas sp.]|jgi:hydrogenase maturation protease|uniref:hydrogenase maturation protease n=1 Tax=Psychromonas sp. TaxID=1884585 RepID=UPI0039E2DB1A